MIRVVSSVGFDRSRLHVCNQEEQYHNESGILFVAGDSNDMESKCCCQKVGSRGIDQTRRRMSSKSDDFS
jgi:hypothetical protein